MSARESQTFIRDADVMVNAGDDGALGRLERAVGTSPPVPDRRGARKPPPCLGKLAMRIAADGTWFYQGTPINRPALVRLFASVLRRDDDGTYHLTTPVEDFEIEVDEVPFVAIDVDASGAGTARTVTLRTNVGDEVTAGPDHPIRVETNAATGEPRPFVVVRDGLEARISRAAFYRLADGAVPARIDGRERLGVWSSGQFFPLDQGETGS